jgi:ferric iron reductase protein FhuF
MIASLAPCFTGALHHFKDHLALPGEHGTSIEGRSLVDGAIAERLLATYAKAYPGADARAVVSMWTQRHFNALLIPSTAAILLMNRDLPVRLDQVSVAIDAKGRTVAIIVADDGEGRAPDVPDRFARLFAGHVEPLIACFAERFKVSPRLLWTNAAASFGWTLRQAGDGACPAALAEALALLTRRTGADGRANPMYDAVRSREQGGEPVLTRRICCLRYLLPGVADCGSFCPLPPARRER